MIICPCASKVPPMGRSVQYIFKGSLFSPTDLRPSCCGLSVDFDSGREGFRSIVQLPHHANEKVIDVSFHCASVQ